MVKWQFSFEVWSYYYRKVKILSDYLQLCKKDSASDNPKIGLKPKERKRIQNEIENLMGEVKDYLNRCKLYPNPARWTYNPNDKKTWASSDKFKFAHLHKEYKTMTVPHKIVNY